MKSNQPRQIQRLFKNHFNYTLHGSESLECAKKHSEHYSELSDAELLKLGFDDFFIKNKSAYSAIAHKKYEWLTQRQIYFMTALLTSNYKSICKYTVKWNLIPSGLRRYL